MKEDMQISKETAKDQLDQLLNYYDLDPDDYKEIQVDGNSAGIAIDVSIKKITKAIMKGRLEITLDDNGRPFVVQHLVGRYKSVDKLTYKPITGSAKVEMDKRKGESNSKLYALMGSLSGEGAEIIQALEGPDLSLVESLGGLFLMA
jgi:hypothetical protein